MRVAVLGDHLGLTEWQVQAVEQIANHHQIHWLISSADRSPDRNIRHAAYYILNLLTIRNKMTRRKAWNAQILSAQRMKVFTPGRDGNWDLLPQDVIDWLSAERIEIVVKFGLGLLRVPRDCPPILSYHHGDPSAYRGRPAGFYETMDGEAFMGQVVQILSNRLDAGDVLAFAETRIHSSSYRRTLIEAFSISQFLLPKALEALSGGAQIPQQIIGKNCKLPHNWTVLKFVFRLIRDWFRHIMYGAFFEKRWRVSTVKIGYAATPIDALRFAEQRRDEWLTPPINPKFSFYADGFFSGKGHDILVEAMHARTGIGGLVKISSQHQQVIKVQSQRHVSYPLEFAEGDKLFVVPEVSDWSPPAAFEIVGDVLQHAMDLDIDRERLLDGTLFRREDKVFLFGNTLNDGPSVLHLWVAESLQDRFRLHPASPIRLSARGSRMAGEIYEHDGAIYRLGQDQMRSYGDGVLIFEIKQLDEECYAESLTETFSFGHVRGPHTVNYRAGVILFDWYRDSLNLFAGLRRLGRMRRMI